MLCTDKNDTVVKFSLPENQKQVVASKYELILPTEKQLVQAIETELQKLPNNQHE